MHFKQTLQDLFKKIQQLPLEITIPAAVFIVVGIFYSLVFFLEKPVTLSYAGKTCVRQLTVLPGLYQVSEGGYTAHVEDKWQVGGVTLASLSMCFTPTEPPEPGVKKVSVAPWDGPFARKTYAITTDPPPMAHMEKLTKPVPTSRPLAIHLSSTDKIFDYKLKIGDQQADCRPAESKIDCDIQELDILQGQTYQAELARYFNGKKVAIVARNKLATLSATKVADSSIKSGDTVYVKPTGIDLVFDKNVTKAQPVLYRIEGEKRTKLEVTSKTSGKTLHVTFAKELPRSADYELVIDGVVATDGSSLEDTFRLPFKISGGPKVTGINVGRTGVPLGVTAVISFDQPLSEKQDISKFVSLSGGVALVGKQGNQLLISLRGVPKCGDFSIKLTNDLQSNYEIAGNSAWNFAGRMVCHVIGTIGYSHQGRAINAYYFGNGPRTVVFTGAIHGSERSTKYLMDRWIQDLEVNAHKIPGDKQIIVVPTINPDGFASGARTNARNIDLNRNFNTSDWRTDVTDVYNRPFPGGGGPGPMSEPETVAIASLVQRLRPMLVLSYHSIGGVVAANQAGISNAMVGTYAALSGYRNATGQSGGTFEYAISGTADDWYAEKLGVASLLIEISSHSYHQFDRNQRAMWAMVNG